MHSTSFLQTCFTPPLKRPLCLADTDIPTCALNLADDVMLQGEATALEVEPRETHMLFRGSTMKDATSVFSVMTSHM